MGFSLEVNKDQDSDADEQRREPERVADRVGDHQTPPFAFLLCGQAARTRTHAQRDTQRSASQRQNAELLWQQRLLLRLWPCITVRVRVQLIGHARNNI